MANGSPVLALSNVSHAYSRDNPILYDISFELNHSEILCIAGPSGCGKTTLLRLVAGLFSPHKGTITIAGVNAADIPTHKRNIGFVFQEEASLFPHLSARQNIEFPFVHGGKKLGAAHDWRDEVGEILNRTGLAPHEHVAIHRLSGGLKQRVAIARALVYRPSLVLLDEPLSSLDNLRKDELIELLLDLRSETGSAFLYVTHDDREILRLADRILVLNEGRVDQWGSAHEVRSTPTDMARRLLRLGDAVQGSDSL